MHNNNTPQDSAKDLEYKDLHITDIRDIVQEHTDWEDSQWNEQKKEAVQEEPKVAVKPAEPITPPTETVKPVVEAQPTPPIASVLDEEKLTKTLTENITKNIVDQLAPPDATVEEKKDLQTKLKDMQDKAEKEGRELTYQEAIAFVKDEAKLELKAELKDEVKKEIREDLDKELAAEEQKAKEAKTAKEKETTKNNNRMYAEWDRQIGVLQAQGFPKVMDKNNPNDPGMQAQKTLFEALNAINKEQQAKGQPVSLSLVEAFMHPTYKQLTTQPGKTAPVNGARKSVGPTEKAGLNYMKDVHNADLRDIVASMYETPQS